MKKTIYNKDKKAGVIALLAATLIWGSSFVVMKDTLEHIPLFFLLAVRFTVSAAILALIGIKKLKTLDIKQLKQGVILGVLLALAYIAQNQGIKYTTPGKNAFLTSVYCIAVPFLNWAYVKKRPDKRNICAAVLSLAGIGLLSLESDFTFNGGDLLTLVGGFFFACHIIALSKASETGDTFLLSMLQFLFAGLISWIGALIFDTLPKGIPSPSLLSLAYLSVLATAGSLTLQSIGQKRLSASSVSVILTLESVFGAALSVILGRDAPTVRLFMGFAVIFSAVLISEVRIPKYK